MSVSLEKNIINLLYTSQFLVIKILHTSEIYTGDWVAVDKFYRLHILLLSFSAFLFLSLLSLPLSPSPPCSPHSYQTPSIHPIYVLCPFIPCTIYQFISLFLKPGLFKYTLSPSIGVAGYTIYRNHMENKEKMKQRYRELISLTYPYFPFALIRF